MLNQTFDPSDIARLASLTFLELLLSADNAIVLGVLSHPLSKELRKKALLIGSISSFFFRAAALLSISFLLKYFWIQILGGLYLIYLSAHHFLKKKQAPLPVPEKGKAFWKIVLFIELFDVAFAIDSILAGLAFIAPTQIEGGVNPKLWIVYIGGMIGLFGIRYAAHLFGHLVDKFPRLEKNAHLLIGWIGLKLLMNVLKSNYSLSLPFEPLFWTVLVLFIALGFTKPKMSNREKK